MVCLQSKRRRKLSYPNEMTRERQYLPTGRGIGDHLMRSGTRPILSPLRQPIDFTYICDSPPFLSLAAVFREQIKLELLFLEAAAVLVKTSRALSGASLRHPLDIDRFLGLLSSKHLTGLESQICHALFAPAVDLNNAHPELKRLDMKARAFINKRLCLTSDLEQRCLIWCLAVCSFDPESSITPDDTHI